MKDEGRKERRDVRHNRKGRRRNCGEKKEGEEDRNERREEEKKGAWKIEKRW